MKAIINTFERSEYAHLNGLTFDIVGHENWFFLILVEGEIIKLYFNEILICDIQCVFFETNLRAEKLGFDYWEAIIKKYIRRNKIKIDRKELPKQIKERQEIVDNDFEDFLSDENIF